LVQAQVFQNDLEVKDGAPATLTVNTYPADVAGRVTLSTAGGYGYRTAKVRVVFLIPGCNSSRMFVN